MSFGLPLKAGECRIFVGDTHTNGSVGRFEEHRRVVKIDGINLEFEVVFGRRAGSVGSCQLTSFWLWSRGQIEK